MAKRGRWLQLLRCLAVPRLTTPLRRSDIDNTRFAIGFCISLACIGIARGGVGYWTRLGPTWFTNPGVFNMAFDPHDDRILYAVGLSGLARSTDYGMTWVRVPTPDLIGPMIRIAPSNPPTIYIESGLFSHDIYRSTNGGSSWSHNSLPDSCAPQDLQIDPTNAAVVFVACWNGSLFSSAPGADGVLTSTDSGRNWRSIGLNNTNIDQIALDPFNPNTIYAKTAMSISNFWKTIDGGATWNLISPDKYTNEMIVVDPQLPARVYAATGSGIYKSVDGAASWERILPGDTSVIAIDPSDSKRLIADNGAMLMSSDEGRTWQGLDSVAVGIHLYRATQLLMNQHALYAVTEVVTTDGQFLFDIVEYEVEQPRRRAVRK